MNRKWTNVREGMLSLNLSRYTNDASISDQNLPQPLTKILFSLALFKEYMSIQSKIVGQLSKQTPTVQRNPSMFREVLNAKFRRNFYVVTMTSFFSRRRKWRHRYKRTKCAGVPSKRKNWKNCWEMAWQFNFVFQGLPDKKMTLQAYFSPIFATQGNLNSWFSSKLKQIS